MLKALQHPHIVAGKNWHELTMWFFSWCRGGWLRKELTSHCMYMIQGHLTLRCIPCIARVLDICAAALKAHGACRSQKGLMRFDIHQYVFDPFRWAFDEPRHLT